MSLFDRVPLDILNQLAVNPEMICTKSEMTTLIHEINEFDFTKQTNHNSYRVYKSDDHKVAVSVMPPVLKEDGTVQEPGQMDFLFWKQALSNFINEPIEITVNATAEDGSVQTFTFILPCTESGFQADKAIAFEDWESLKKILSSKTPQECKAFGNKVAGFDKDLWAAMSEDVMQNLVNIKMAKNPDVQTLMSALKTVAEAHKINFPQHLNVVEASPFDEIWGAGLNPDDVVDKILDTPPEKRSSTALFHGKNLLGKCWDNAIEKYMGANLELNTTPLKKARVGGQNPEGEPTEFVPDTPDRTESDTADEERTSSVFVLL